METLTQPEFVMQRKICEHCGEGIFEFYNDRKFENYSCTDCSKPE